MSSFASNRLIRLSTLDLPIYLIPAGLILALAIATLARDPKPHGQVVAITVHSAALENNRVKDSPDRAVSIYLPPDYDSGSRRYPVLYLLHGYTGDERGWMNPSYVGLPEIMDRLLQQHAIQDLGQTNVAGIHPAAFVAGVAV